MSTPSPEVSAVLLAGGSSRRMGTAKPFLRVGGRATTARLLDEAASVASQLLLSVRRPEPFRRALPGWGWRPREEAGDPDVYRSGHAELTIVPDRRPGLGPLAGIEAGVAAARGARCLLVAVDLPLASAPLFRVLLAELDRRGGSGGPGAPDGRPWIVLPVLDGRRQPLCSALDAEAGRIATACLDEGLRSVTAWTHRLTVHEIDAERLERSLRGLRRGQPRRAGVPGRRPFLPLPTERQLFDLDTPEDLRRARRGTAGVARRPDGEPSGTSEADVGGAPTSTDDPGGDDG